MLFFFSDRWECQSLKKASISLIGCPSSQEQLGMCLPSGWKESQEILVGQVAKSSEGMKVLGLYPHNIMKGALVLSLK